MVLAYGILLVPYVLCWLAYFPGIFSYDVNSQTRQALGAVEWTNHHPVLHTLLWKCFLKVGNTVGNPEISLILYCLFQIVFVCGICLYVVKYIYRKSGNVILALFVYLYYLCVPTLHIFSFILSKDVLFSSFFILFFMELWNLLENGEVKNNKYFFVWGLLACFFRNNMIYVVVAITIGAFLFRLNKKIYRPLYMIILLYVLAVKMVYPLFSIAPTEKAEALSVPLSQLAGTYVYMPDEFSDSEKGLVKEYIPDAEDYNPRLADWLKYEFNQTLYEEDTIEFWKLYFNVFLKHPMTYINIFLDLNVNYWYIGSVSPDPFSRVLYIETGVIKCENYLVEQRELLPKLHLWYEGVANCSHLFMKIPVISFYFSLSFTFVSLYVCLYLILRRKEKVKYILYIMLIILFFSYLVGPVSNYRYMYTFYFSLPVYIYLLIHKFPMAYKEKK